jgi:hypothetical protein
VDRVYARSNQPDHGDLLASLVRWVARDRLPVRVAGRGVVDVHAYVQGADQPATGSGAVERADRVVVHLVNLNHANAWKAPIDDFAPLGEQRVMLLLPPAVRAASARLLVAGADAACDTGTEGMATVTVPRIEDHEVVVAELTAVP